MQKTFDLPRDFFGEQLVQPGVLSCQGCGATLAMKLALQALGSQTVVVIPACCWGIIVGVWPYSAVKVPVVHAPFATAGIMASGVKAGLTARGENEVVVMAWAGDGGTFDIGLQSLSGAAERNEDIIFVCYDNEAYMNTGVQRSSATPMGAWTTTTPRGALKAEPKKDIVTIMRGHHIPYIATASIAFPDDVVRKFKKARRIKGTKFIHLLSPCPPGWRIDSAKSVQSTRLATQSNLFPLYEIENGRTLINYNPDRPVAVETYLASQGRFRQMDRKTVALIQAQTDRRWEQLNAQAADRTGSHRNGDPE